MLYKDKVSALRCEKWCAKNHNCDTEIIKNDNESNVNDDESYIKNKKELSLLIIKAMESKKYYLNHDLTIYDLSKKLNILYI